MAQLSDNRVTAIDDRLRNATRGANFTALLILLFMIDVMFVTALLIVVAPQHLFWVLPVMVLAPAVAVWIVIRLTWARWAHRYPAQPQQIDAVIRANQTFRLGAIGKFNHCIYIAADADCLHLIPARLLRLLGAAVISLPFDLIHDVGRKPRWGLVSARIDRRSIAGPEWCMALARRDAA